MTRRFIALCLLLAAATVALAHDTNSMSYVLKRGDSTRIVNFNWSDSQRFETRDDFLWVELEGRGYLIRDERVLDEADRIFAPYRAISAERRELKSRTRTLRQEQRSIQREIRNAERQARRADREADTRELERQIERLEPRMQDLERDIERLDARRDEARRVAERDFERLVQDAIRGGRAEQRDRP